MKIKRSSQTKFYMLLNNNNKKIWLQKIEEHNLIKQKYFECKYIYYILHRKTHPNYILHSLQDQLN